MESDGALLKRSRRLGHHLAVAMLVPLLGVLATAAAIAKTPGTTYCFRDVCHRVKTLEETRAAAFRPTELVASFYDDCQRDVFNPCGLTSSGEVFRPLADDNAASPIYPDGTRLLVWSPTSRIAAVIRVNNAGPYMSNRLLDVSRGLAERLGFASRGIARLETMVLSAPSVVESRYVRGRVYARVPGVIGVFPTLQVAWANWRQRDRDGGDPTPSPTSIAAADPGRALGEVPAAAVAPQRVVRIGRTRAASAATRGRAGSSVVLRPVAARRPLMLKALAARKGPTRTAAAR